jgi:hypothetical protein
VGGAASIGGGSIEAAPEGEFVKQSSAASMSRYRWRLKQPFATLATANSRSQTQTGGSLRHLLSLEREFGGFVPPPGYAG